MQASIQFREPQVHSPGQTALGFGRNAAQMGHVEHRDELALLLECVGPSAAAALLSLLLELPPALWPARLMEYRLPAECPSRARTKKIRQRKATGLAHRPHSPTAGHNMRMTGGGRLPVLLFNPFWHPWQARRDETKKKTDN